MVKYGLAQKYYALQVQPDLGSESWPPDHDSTFHITEMLVLATRSPAMPDMQHMLTSSCCLKKKKKKKKKTISVIIAAHKPSKGVFMRQSPK